MCPKNYPYVRYTLILLDIFNKLVSRHNKNQIFVICAANLNLYLIYAMLNKQFRSYNLTTLKDYLSKFSS